MQYRSLLSALSLALAPSLAFAQITIDAGDYPFDAGSTITVTSYNEAFSLASPEYATLQALGAATGANQTWDLTTLPLGQGETIKTHVQSFDPAGPGGSVPHFANASLRIDVLAADNPGIDGNIHSFQTINSAGVFEYGQFAEDANLTLTNTNEPYDLTVQFPLTSGSQWVSEFTETSVLPTATLVSQITNTRTVEGWGTLVTPGGSYDALRVLSVREIKDATGTVTLFVDSGVDFLTKEGVSGDLGFDSFFGAWESAGYTTLTTSTAVEPLDGDLPENVAVSQNFPNPADRSTTVEFALEKSGHVQLAVYDVIGREVARPVDELLPAGTYQATVDTQAWPTGAYVYRIAAGEQTMTRRMLVVR